ncbi:hypothetical protein NV379_04285 [Paenibacillus sp. N1-5-1-14]|uniref:hypothetical protein n=1 Tax=Paenibacillus radicibacter TaxID=2972488 RepID=UPI002159905E|nr:hypothetical protein [Paenibacillus radicibacter]MCR8641870.1 hypothetical protein [Paenibacillus radicibacter]
MTEGMDKRAGKRTKVERVKSEKMRSALSYQLESLFERFLNSKVAEGRTKKTRAVPR